MSDEANLTRTDWSMIAAASAEDREQAAAAAERLARRYWPAVYAFVRRMGRDVHEAADLTQGFICDVVIGRRLVESADPARGRFRSLLLTALKNYLREVHRKRRCPVEEKPRAGSAALPGIGGQPDLPEHRTRASSFVLRDHDITAVDLSPEPTPEAAFSAQWSAMLVRNVLEQVRQSCLADGLEAHWTVFEYRVVRPMLFGADPMPYPALVEWLDLDSPPQARNMMITAKRRFASALYTEVCATIDDAAGAEEEMFDLLRELEA